jgi:hypothetical protein
LTASAANAAIIYVDKDATGAQNGASWATAYRELQPALDAAAGGDEVWVANGLYDESRTGNANGALLLRANVAVYGGFAGTEAIRAQRNPVTNIATISGANGRGAGAAAYSVVEVAGAGATLDGFTITGGNANGSDAIASQVRGGGMYIENISVTVRNCNFVGNNAKTAGGGMAIQNCWDGNAVRIEYCTFDANTSLTGAADFGLGGGLNMLRTDAKIHGCTFKGNLARYGGGIYAVWSQKNISGNPNAGNLFPEVYNCVFWLNNAQARGGGLYNHNSATVVKHCTFYNNGSTSSDPVNEQSGANGGAITTSNVSQLPRIPGTPANYGQPQIINSVFVLNSGDQIFTGPLSAGGPAAAETFNYESPTDPAIFQNAGAGDFRPNSGAIGSIIDVPLTPNQADVLVDRNGTFRPLLNTTGQSSGATIKDRGAYEYDRFNPTAVCKANIDLTFNLSTDLNRQITAYDVDNGSSDAGGIKRLDLSGPGVVNGGLIVSCATVGTALRTMTVTDFDGNAVTCGAAITIVDDVDPVIALQPFTLNLDSASTVTFANVNNGSFDNCALNLAATQITPNTFDCSNLGPNLVTVTIEDVNGNQASAQTTVTVEGSLVHSALSPVSNIRYAGQTLATPFLTEVECGIPPYTNFEWFYDADGFGTGAAEQAITNGLGGHPADPSLTVTIGGTNPQSSLDLGVLTTAAEGFYRCVVTDTASLTQASPVFTLTSPAPVSIVTDPVGGTRTIDPPFNFISMSVVAAGGYPAYTYQWFGPSGQLSNGVNGAGTTVAGVTTDTLTLTNTHAADSGNYYVVVYDQQYTAPADVDSFEQSANAVLVVNNDLQIFDNPDNASVYSGDTVNLAIQYSGGVGPYFFQWIDEDLNLWPGSPDAPTWNITNIQANQGGSYRCLVTDSSPSTQFVISEEAIVIVTPSVTFTTQPLSGHRNTGGSYTFNVAVTGGYPPYTYEWFKTGNPTALQSGPSASFTLNALTLADTGDYYCVATDTNTPVDSSAQSNNASLLVTDLLAVELTTGTATGIDGLVASSTNLTDVYTNGSFTLSVTASGGNLPYGYQWQVDYGSGWQVAPGVSTNQTYSVASATVINGYPHRCVVSDNSPDPDVSAGLTVGVYGELFITAPPADTTVNVTEIANFTVFKSGGIPPFTYTWRQNGNPLGAANQDTLAYGPAVYPGDDGTTFDVIIDDAVVGDAKTSTPVAVLTVTNNIGVNLGADRAAYVGDVVVITPDAVGGGNGNFTYTWTKDGNPVSDGGSISGATTDTLTITGAVAGDAGTYALTVEDDSGSNQPDTDDAVLSVVPHLSITTQPADTSAYEGAQATISVIVSGGIAPITYDWRESTVSLGAPSQNSYVIPSVAFGDDGKVYDVVITESDSDYSAGIPQTSDPATLSVAPQLVVTGPVPASVQAYTTDPAFQLEVTVSGGFGSETYQWYVVVPFVGPVPAPGFTVNPQPIDPGTVASLLGTGTYDVFCVVSDAGGDVPSGNSVVEIADELSIVDGLQDSTADEGTDFTWEIVVDGGLSPITYQWSRDVGGAKVLELLPGENGSTLLLEDLALEDTGEYLVEVTDGGTGAVSSQATLTVEKGLPAAGLLGLSILTIASALGGATVLRRRK